MKPTVKPTEGPWRYNEAETEVQSLARPLAVLLSVGRTLAQREVHANGYLMAAAPQLRDELTNLSRAVRDYLDYLENDTVYEEDIRVAENELDVMLKRAERALATIFPPEPTA